MELVVLTVILGGLLIKFTGSSRSIGRSVGRALGRSNRRNTTPKPVVRQNNRRRTLEPVIRPNNRRRIHKPTYQIPAMPKSMMLQGRAYVIDGDTIRINGTKIRLAGIDAPELDMPYGQKSKWAMVEICKGQTITAELDGERSFDRLVGTCYLPDGRDIGAELIKQGLALDLPEFSRGKYRHLEPPGVRRRLANGQFGHASIRIRKETTIKVTRS